MFEMHEVVWKKCKFKFGEMINVFTSCRNNMDNNLESDLEK